MKTASSPIATSSASKLKSIVSFSLLTGLIFPLEENLADAVFDPQNQPLASIAPYVLSSTNLEKGPLKAYRPWFEAGTWQGDLIEHQVETNGTLLTDVVIQSDGSADDSGTNWSARSVMHRAEQADKNYWKDGRKIITSTSANNQRAFRWGELSSAQKLQIAPSGSDGDKLLEFIRGNRKEEDALFRVRAGILSDNIRSAPVYVGAPATGYNTLPDYVPFSNTPRAARIYQAGNDGMVHVFDAANGEEVYAYVPSMLFSQLGTLASHQYTHRDLFNSELVAADARIDSSWKTVLAGGLGAAAKGLFALDVTHPGLSNETASSGNDKKILWEKRADTDPDLGHIYGPSSIVMLPNDKWYVINGNGYGSQNGDARLTLVELGTGSIRYLSTSAGINNGLSAPALVDVDFDSRADFAYAGDLQGKLWKFDLSDLTKPGVLLFNAGTSKPITTRPEVALHPVSGHLVYFGTGSLLSDVDRTSTDQQSIYAIRDENSEVSNTCGNASGNLLCQNVSADIVSGAKKLITLSADAIDWDVHRGWKIDLPHSGERLIGNPQLRDGRLQLVTHNPTGEINESWLLELDYLSGGRVDKIIYDLDDDGVLGAGDKVNGVPPSGLFLGQGLFSQPAIARVKDGIDAKFINGLLPNHGDSQFCSGDCANGLAGGHFDLDVDIELGGGTDKHTHEYDDKYDVTYGDYFNVLNGGSSLDSVEVGIDSSNQKLLALIANADLSIGGMVEIGNKTWNALEYQKMVHKKLLAWDGISELVDDDGDPLGFTIDQVKQSNGGTGTVSLKFVNTAILTGGLVPTKTGCVTGSPSITNGHWRNGALTLHVVDYETVRQSVQQNNAGQFIHFQQVSDLPDSIMLETGPITLKEDTNADGVFDIEYAGMVANLTNPGAFLFESTLFWHYKGSCYGEPSWQQERDEATITAQELADFMSQQATLINQIQAYSCIDFSKGVCKDAAYESLINDLSTALRNSFDNQIAEIDEFVLSVAELFTNGSGSTSTTTVHAPNDETVVIPVSPGPSFRWGRQTWIDL